YRCRRRGCLAIAAKATLQCGWGGTHVASSRACPGGIVRRTKPACFRRIRRARYALQSRLFPAGAMMAPNATIHRVELQGSDTDRHYYAEHNLTLAQHPSETPARLMVRLVAFALFADDRLEFGRGLSSEEEPDLWQRDYTGDIEQWIDLGQPDESRIRKACGRAKQVAVVNY